MKKLIFMMVVVLPLCLGSHLYAADQDGDSVSDESDNCPLVANSNQTDSNFNHIGDICESDWDGDGVSDTSDNCWDVKNFNQADLDQDGAGDVCDIDRDGDGYGNDFETSISWTNPDSWDTDSDGVSDLFDCGKNNAQVGPTADCSVVVVQKTAPPPLPPTPDTNPNTDDDGDGILNAQDNCPAVFNPGQQDNDADGVGDACDNEASISHPVVYAQGGGGMAKGGCSLGGIAGSKEILSILALFLVPPMVFGSFRKRN